MNLTISSKSMVVFDLDDTLYKEVEYLKSAYRHLARIIDSEKWPYIYNEMYQLWRDKEPVFDIVHKKYALKMTIPEMVEEYRFHFPDIKLSNGVLEILNELKTNNTKIGLLTDGRSKSQRNKLQALGITNYFDQIIISEELGSEKPNEKNYKAFMDEYPGFSFTYIGDNFKKDFIRANEFNWTTIALLDQGRNIHSQNIEVTPSQLPQHTINTFSDLNLKFI